MALFLPVFIFSSSGCCLFSGNDHLIADSFRPMINGVYNEKERVDYLLQLPKEPKHGKLFPLLYVHHGRGQIAGQAMEEWSDEAERIGFAVLAPARDRAYENTPESLHNLYALVDQITKKYPIDSKRIVIAGVSAGGLITRWLVENDPGRWEAAVFVANPPFDWTFFKHDNLDKFPPMLFVHGLNDPQFDIEDVRKAVQKVKDAKINAVLIEYPDAGHEHRPEWNDRIFQWIEKVETKGHS